MQLASRHVLWALLLLGAWMTFVVTTALPEVLLGVGSAIVAGLVMAVLRAHAGATGVPKLRWLRDALVLLPRLVTDTLVVFRVLFLHLSGKQQALGAFRALPYEPNQPDALSASMADAFVVAVNSLTPNTIVLDIDPVEGLLLVHQPQPQRHDEASRALVRPS
jgi:multisubunit Na+/H+ antiporter MnhE subunit